MTHEYTVVFYRQYGQWYVTIPFYGRRDAERHARLYLDDPKKDYIKDIVYHAVELPED